MMVYAVLFVEHGDDCAEDGRLHSLWATETAARAARFRAESAEDDPPDWTYYVAPVEVLR